MFEGKRGGIMQNLDIGIVVDTNDPSGNFRVRVDIPAVIAGQSLWALVCRSPASGGGAPWLPAVGEEVLVGFLRGDVDMPIVLGSLHNPATPPASAPSG
jgi:uncharacterized protein involved in type VI secretion and phage assembly